MRILELRKKINTWGLFLSAPTIGSYAGRFIINDMNSYQETFDSLDEVEAWMKGRTWTVSAVHRESGHCSRVKPFRSAKHAAYFTEKHRPEKDWKDVRITSKSGR